MIPALTIIAWPRTIVAVRAVESGMGFYHDYSGSGPVIRARTVVTITRTAVRINPDAGAATHQDRKQQNGDD